MMLSTFREAFAVLLLYPFLNPINNIEIYTIHIG